MYGSSLNGQLGLFGKTLLLAAMTVLFSVIPLRAQDDNGGPPPPPPDNGQPKQGDPNGAPPPDAALSGPVDNGASDAGSQDSASFQTFYDSLSNQGTWIQSNDYGYVWQPQENDPDWAPYTEGHWVYTEDGWTWVSDESFGWATYHYGRWVNLDGTGWVWVPGYTWGPAWVSWRYGNGYCGWAPLPPDSFVGIDYSGDNFDADADFHIGGDCDGFYGIGAGLYIFLPVNCLGYRHYHGYYCHRGDNFAIINRTTNVTNINVTRNRAAAAGINGARGFRRVTAGGPMLAQVNSVSSTPVQHVNLVRTSQASRAGLTDNSLTVFAPHVRAGTAAQPSQVTGSIARSAINRGTDITQPPAVNSRLTPNAATEAQVQQARIAQDHAPASAKVISDAGAIHPILQTPLTSLHPISHEPSSTSRTFNTSPGQVFNTDRGGPVVSPSVRSNPQAGGGTPSRVYSPGTTFQPRSNTTSPGTTHTVTHSTAPASSAPSSSATPSSSGGNSNSSGGASSGGASQGGGGSGGGNGGYHSGGGGGGGGGFHGGGGDHNH